MSLLDFFTKQSPTEWLTKQLTPKSSGMRFEVGSGLNQQQTQQAQQTVRKSVTPVAPNPFDNIKNWVIKSITPPVEDFAKIGKAIPQATQPITNAISSYGKGVGDITMGILQGTARSGGSVGATLMGEKEIPVEDKYSQLLFGKGNIESLGTRIEKFPQRVGEVGVPENISKPLAPFAILGITALDFTGAGGSKTVTKMIAKSKKASEIAGVLKKIGVADDLIDDYAEALVKVTKESEVTKVLNHIDEIQKTTKTTKPFNVLDDMALKSNPLIQEAKKYKSAEEFVKAQNRGYGMQHRPTETGATANEISQLKSEMGLPKDFYTHPEYYADMSSKSYQESFSVLKKIRGNPEANVTIYRASPKPELNRGDWVTLSKNYAKGESLAENTPVNSFKVKAKDIQFAGDDINEFGYYPEGKTVKESQLTDIWKKANKKTTMAVKSKPLIQEAKEYKTAEEFVKAQKIKPNLQEKYKNVELSIYENGDEITLSKIVVPKNERGAGVGTQVMNDLVEYADKTGQRIILTPTADFGGSVSRLKDFYKRFGFIENKGRTKDFSTRETFIRPSKTKSQLTDIWKKANKPISDIGQLNGKAETLDYLQPKQTIKTTKTISNKQVVLPRSSSQLPSQIAQKTQTPTSKTPPPLEKLAKQKGLSSYKINVKHFNIAETKKQIIEKETETIKPILESKIGKVLSNKEVKDIADNTAIIMERGAGREQTKNWEAAMFNLRQRIASAAESGTVDKVFIDDLVNLKSQGSDIARKLQSLSMAANAKDMTSKRVILEAVLRVTDKTDEILEAAKDVDFNDYNQAVEFYRKFVKPTMGEWMDLVRYNSMLSSPNTHIVNTFSNLVNSAIIAPVEKSIAGGVDFLGSKIFKYPQKNFSGEGLEYARNYYKGIGDASKRFLGVLKGERGMTNLDLRFIPPSTKGKSGKIATVLSYPTRLLEASDQFFTALTESGERAAMSYKMSKGVKVAHPEIAIKDKSAYRLFRQDLFSEGQGAVLDAVDRVTNIIMTARNSPNWVVRNISKFSLPFVKTPMNIFKQGIEYSPLGITTLPGAANKSEQLAKVIMGSSIGTALAIYASSDRLTFDSPTGAKEKTLWAQAGKQPYSIKIGDKWISYQKMPPMFSFPIAIFAGTKKLLDNKKIDEDTASVLLGSLANAMQYYGDQSYFKSIGDIIGAAKGDQYSIEKVFSNIPQQLVPFRALGGWLAKLTDDTQRTIDNKAGFVDKQMQLLFMNIPGMSQRLPAKLDERGKPIPSSNRLLNALSPVRVSRENKQLADFLSNYESLKKDTAIVQEARDEQTEKVRPIYDKIQTLIDEGKIDEARVEVNRLSEEDYKTYKKIKSTDKASETRSAEVKFYPTFKQIRKLVDEGKEIEARKMLDDLSDKDYELYKKLKKRLTK